MNRSSLTTGTLVASLFLSPHLFAQDPVIKKIIKEGIEKSQVMKFQDHLCNTIGQRLTGSAGYDRAAKWAVEEFQKMGLQARLDPWGSWKMAWDRGQWQGRVLEPFEMELQVATPAWTGATRGQVKGLLVRMPKELNTAVLDELFAQGPVYLWGAIRRRSNTPALLEPYQRSGKLLGVVMSARSAGSADNRRYPNQIRVFGDSSVARRSWEKRAKLVQVVVRNDQAEKIEASLKEGEKVVIQLEIRNRYRRGPVTLNNVVADIRGSEFPDEYVIICGHMDSWHQAAGATDNGTGTCTTMEAARILSAAGVKPKRTLRFILWSGEEQGLLGSRGYVQRNRTKMDKVSAVFNHDNGTNWASSVTVTDHIAPLIASVADAVNTLPNPDPTRELKDGKFFHINSRPEVRLSSGGSDHASFSPALVPAFGWRLTGKLSYGYGWHSQWDTYDLVVPAYQRHNATTFALMAYTIAQLDQKLPREGLLKPSRGGRGRGQAGAVIGYVFGASFKGLQVTKINETGFAKNAGMKVGDVITAFNGKEVKSAADITSALRNRGGNRGDNNRNTSRKMTVKVKRDGKEKVLEGERPERRRRR